MKSAAVVIGIDAYGHKPLTSAVNDARAFAQALLDLRLVGPADLTLLTAPLGAGGALPTRDNIANTLYDLYENGDDYDRLYFYFAGHGLLAFSGGEKDRLCTALLAQDVVDLRRDGNKLLDLEEVRDRLRLAGPQEQFYFIDACREYDYDRRPKVGALGWEARAKPLGAARSQATLYAVSELGLAEATRGGQGQMTAPLVHALRDDVAAVQFDDGHGQWVITVQSVADYVKTVIGESLDRNRAYLRKYLEPQLHAPDPRPGPLRTFDSVPEVPLTVHIEPEEAAATTRVTLSLRGMALADKSLPPQRNHEPILLAPQYYLYAAASSIGTPAPQRDTVDVRRCRELTIHVAGVPGVSKASAPPSAPRDIAAPGVSYRRAPQLGGLGQIQARTLEQAAMVELEGLEPPYARQASPGSLDAQVPPGPYRVRFRLGAEVYNLAEVYVHSGEVAQVSPTIANSALVREALALGPDLPADVVVSESIGPMQADLLPTMLTILGVKPFDVRHSLFHQFEDVVPLQDPAAFDFRPLAVVVAVDGNGWRAPAETVVRQTTWQVVPLDHPLSASPAGPGLPLQPLARSQLAQGGGPQPSGPGLDRIGLGLMTAPAGSFALEFDTPLFGRFRLFCGSITRRVTVVTILLHPQHGLAVSQNLLRLPGRDELYVNEWVPDVPYGRLLRELQLGQQLYSSGELAGQGLSAQASQLMRDLLFAKWSDPILSCMAFFGLEREALRRQAAGEPPLEPWLRGETADNLNRFFGEVPDARVAYGLSRSDQHEPVFDQLLSARAVPLLAESARHLARYAEARGDSHAPVVEIAGRIRADQIWSLVPLGR